MRLQRYLLINIFSVLFLTISQPVLSQTGDLAPLGNRDGKVDVGDALIALRFALGLETPTPEDIQHGDVAPLDAQGLPDPDGQIKVGDALVILRKALNLIDWTIPVAGNQKPVASPISLSTDLSIPYLEQQLIATDADGDSLRFELMADPTGPGYAEAYVSPVSGMLYVTLASDGTTSIILPYHVTDGQLFSDPVNITIEVLEIPPEERSHGMKDIDPVLYASFPSSSFSGDLLGSPGEPPTYPSAIDLSDNFPIPGDQGEQGSCVGWATAYALKSYQEGVEMGWSLNTSDHLFSPAFIYNQINGGIDKGSNPKDALDLIVTKGAATWSTMPYDEDDYLTQPNAQAFQDAANFKAKEWLTVGGIQETKAALANRKPVLFGILADALFDALHGPNAVYNTFIGVNPGGHAVTITGYDDNRYGGAFRVINSYGLNWGDNGYFWLPYDFAAQEVVIGAYVLEDTENTVTPEPHDPTIPDPTGDLPNLEVMSWDADYDPRPRGEGSLQWKVINTGTGVAPAGANVNMILSANSDITSSDILVIYEEIPFDLDPGHAAYRDEDNTISFTFPDSLEEGIYFMALWVDDLDEIVESNEEDNISLADNQVTIENDKPDLNIRMWYTTWHYYWGSLIYEVANDGNSTIDTSDWYINLVLSTDQIIGNGDEIFLFYDYAGVFLAPGDTIYRDQWESGSFYLYEDAFGDPVPDGIYYMSLWVDDLDKVDESNELNNTSFSWDTFTIGGTSSTGQNKNLNELRHTKKGEAGGMAYNGRPLPLRNVVMRKVKISDTPMGGRSLTFLDEKATSPELGKASLLLPKVVSSKNHVIFPITKRIPMPPSADHPVKQ